MNERAWDAGGFGDVGHLLDILGGKARLQALSTITAIGIPDLLAGGARTADELANAISSTVDVELLTSLLGVCVGLGFLACPRPDVFELTDRGHLLCRDRLGPLVDFAGSREQWDSWSRLRDAVAERSSSTPFEMTFGADLYGWLARDVAAAERYDTAIEAFTRDEARALCDAHDFARVRTVVDVGGGRGAFVAALAQHHQHLRGVVLELPHVAERTARYLDQRLSGAMRERIAVCGGDYHDAVPAGGDVYLLAHVLHNLGDAQAGALLARCAAAIEHGDGRVLVVDAVRLPGHRADFAEVLDVEMRVLTGGRQRRKPEFRRLFDQAGLVVDEVVALTPKSSLLVGRAAR